MGNAATLFFNANDREKQTLLRRCSPSDEQFDEQKDRWNALADHLLSDLKDRSGHTIRTWLQGSYKFGTQIRPIGSDEEFDIDLGVYFLWTGKPADGTHSPQTLKGFVQESLSSYKEIEDEDVEEVTKPKTRCSRIRYKNSFHIDVPSYHLDQTRDARTLTTTDGWESSDPKSIYLWFRDQFDGPTRDKVRRHVRYLKTWAALKFKVDDGRPSSIMLTVLAAEASIVIGAKKIGADDDALRDIVAEIVKRFDKSQKVPNPVDKNEDLNRLTVAQKATFVTRLKEMQDVADRAIAGETDFEAADIWQEAFEHMFPLPEASEVLAKDARNLPVAVISPEIKITAVSRTNKVAPAITGYNRIGPIPKNCTITFEVTNAAHMPAGSQIFWIVRNEGREAELTNDLGHIGQTGSIVTERSAYKGTHSMDCIVKIGRRTVTWRRVPVAVSGLEMPSRNPPRKIRFA